MATVERANHNPRVMKIVNPLVKFLVARGWGRVADQIMVLHWTGKKTGTAYSTPVSRFDLDDQLFTQTKAGYKSNFVGGGPAELVFDGRRRAYVGTTIDDAEVVGRRMRSVLDALGIKDGSRALGLKIDGEPTTEQLVEFASRDGAVVIDFEPV